MTTTYSTHSNINFKKTGKRFNGTFQINIFFMKSSHKSQAQTI